MNAEQLKEVERLCTVMSTPGVALDAKNEATKQLSVLGTNAQFIPQCQYILDNSENQYALALAATSLTKLITEHWGNFTVDQRVDIHTYLLTYLARKGPTLQHFVVGAVIQLLCRITKLGWFDEGARLRSLVSDTTAFLQESVQHCIIGIKILNELVSEFNHTTIRRTLTTHRRMAVSFRDISLFNVFEIAMTMMRQILSGKMGIKDQNLEEKLLDFTLKLVINCLSFDFIGTNPDESVDEVGTIQLTLKWRESVENPATLKTFFDMYTACCNGQAGGSSSGDVAMGGAGAGAGAGTAPRNMPQRLACAAEVLECLVLFVSVRRSLFSAEEARRNFLLSIMNGVCEVMRLKIGLADMDCYHQFCRLLGKLKANYQLSDLVKTTGYSAWIRLAADFAVTSFKQAHTVSNSLHYILGLWSRLVAAAPHLSMEARAIRAPDLDEHAPKVAFSYISSRVASAEAAVQGTIENDLDDEELIEMQLEQLPLICRYEYTKLCNMTTELMDPLIRRMNEIQQLMRTGADATLMHQLRVVEVQLAWLVYFIGAIIGGNSYGYTLRTARANEELVDADLSRRVLSIMNNVELRLSSTNGVGKTSPHLELALLYYIRNFRKSYVGEQHGMPAPGREDAKPNNSKQKAFAAMFSRMGYGDHLNVVSSFIIKLGSNLRYWGDNMDIIQSTLTLLSELAITYSSVKLLLTLNAVTHMLANHSAQHFPFLLRPENTRLRTTYYTALSRLVLMDDDPARFETFLSPIMQTLELIKQNIRVRSEEVKQSIIGVCRDLRGICIGITGRNAYIQLFENLYPNHMGTLIQALAVWYDTPAVTSPLLKFFAELVCNKHDRIVFGNASPNGILLFRETSRLLSIYAERIVGQTPTQDLYAHKYKGVSICLQIMSLALSGNYVQFGVFELYGDPALQTALAACLRMALDLPSEALAKYTKVSKKYYSFMDVLSRHYLKALVTLDPPIFVAIIKTIQEGLDCLDASVTDHAACVMDHIAERYVTSRRQDETITALRARVSEHPSFFPSFTSMLFNIVVFGEAATQWRLGRPLLSLILACEIQQPKSFDEFRADFIRRQPAESHAELQKAFEDLMTGIKSTLDPVNRDRFINRLALFRKKVRDILKF